MAPGVFALVRRQGISVPERDRCERRPGCVIRDANLEGHAPKDGQAAGRRSVRAAREGRRCHGCSGHRRPMWRSQGIVGTLWHVLSQLKDRLRCARAEAGATVAPSAASSLSGSRCVSTPRRLRQGLGHDCPRKQRLIEPDASRKRKILLCQAGLQWLFVHFRGQMSRCPTQLVCIQSYISLDSTPIAERNTTAQAPTRALQP